MKNMLKWLSEEESGQGMVEYGLILAFVALAAVTALGTVGKQLVPLFEDVANKFPA